MDRLHRNLRHRCCCFLEIVAGKKTRRSSSFSCRWEGTDGWSLNSALPEILFKTRSPSLSTRDLKLSSTPILCALNIIRKDGFTGENLGSFVGWYVYSLIPCNFHSIHTDSASQQVANTYKTSKTPPTMPSQRTSIPSPSSNPTPSRTSVSP
jgi:hypothetical protein